MNYRALPELPSHRGQKSNQAATHPSWSHTPPPLKQRIDALNNCPNHHHDANKVLQPKEHRKHRTSALQRLGNLARNHSNDQPKENNFQQLNTLFFPRDRQRGRGQDEGEEKAGTGARVGASFERETSSASPSGGFHDHPSPSLPGGRDLRSATAGGAPWFAETILIAQYLRRTWSAHWRGQAVTITALPRSRVPCGPLERTDAYDGRPLEAIVDSIPPSRWSPGQRGRLRKRPNQDRPLLHAPQVRVHDMRASTTTTAQR